MRPPNVARTRSSRHRIFPAEPRSSSYPASCFNISFPSFCASPKNF
jgi:hypothetical protein